MLKKKAFYPGEKKKDNRIKEDDLYILKLRIDTQNIQKKKNLANLQVKDSNFNKTMGKRHKPAFVDETQS